MEEKAIVWDGEINGRYRFQSALKATTDSQAVIMAVKKARRTGMRGLKRLMEEIARGSLKAEGEFGLRSGPPLLGQVSY